MGSVVRASRELLSLHFKVQKGAKRGRILAGEDESLLERLISCLRNGIPCRSRFPAPSAKAGRVLTMS